MPKKHTADTCAECKVRFRQTGSSLCWWCAKGISPLAERTGAKDSTSKQKKTTKRTKK